MYIKFACHLVLTDNWCFYILEESNIIDAKLGFSVGIKDYGKTWSLDKGELK